MKNNFEELFEKNKEKWLFHLQVTRLTYQHIIEDGDINHLNSGCSLCEYARIVREKEYSLGNTEYPADKVRPAMCHYCVHLSKYGEGKECMQQGTFRAIFFRSFQQPISKADIQVLKRRISRLLNIEKKMQS